MGENREGKMSVMERILMNGHFVTMDPQRPKAEAVALSKGKIVALGSREEVMTLKTRDTEVVDLRGKTVVPGFNDSHLHLLSFGMSLERFECSTFRSIDQLVEGGRLHLENHQIPAGQWLLGRGWNSLTLEEGRDLTRHDLDRISTRHPIFLTRICGHIAAANTKALEMAGINRETPHPAGGHIDLDQEGNPLGLFRENARSLIQAVIPVPSPDQIKAMLLRAGKVCAGYGITSVQSDDFEALSGKDFHQVIQAYQALVTEGNLPIRVYEQCLLPDMDQLNAFLEAGWRTGVGDEYFKIGPLKLLTDGSLGARTALLSEPYADDPGNCGIAVFSQEELDRLVVRAHQAGMQVALHAIGDAAMTMCFKSFEAAQQHHYKKNPRFGIIHLQITTEALLKRFAKTGVIAYAEPVCLGNDLHMVEQRLGKERAEKTYQYRRLVDDGVPVCLSSDSPVDSINPMISLHAAVTRQDEQGFPAGGWLPRQKLTVDQALRAMTLGSAYASFEEKLKGSIEPGKVADLAVLSEDPFRVPAEELQHITVEMTFMNGKMVYSCQQDS